MCKFVLMKSSNSALVYSNLMISFEIYTFLVCRMIENAFHGSKNLESAHISWLKSAHCPEYRGAQIS